MQSSLNNISKRFRMTYALSTNHRLHGGRQATIGGLLGGAALLPVCMMDSVNRFAPQGRRLGPSNLGSSKPTMAQVLHTFYP